MLIAGYPFCALVKCDSNSKGRDSVLLKAIAGNAHFGRRKKATAAFPMAIDEIVKITAQTNKVLETFLEG